MQKEKSILIVNDDSVYSTGIKHLVDIAKEFGKVIVVAPAKEQSGMGHSISITQPLRLNKINDILDGVPTYECSGTPADCVKIALSECFSTLPDLCLSGINHGTNHSINVFYSGTMAGAIEAAINNIPAIAFSFGNHHENADFDEVKFYAKKILNQFFKQTQLPKAFVLNINFPNIQKNEKIKGIKICKQSNGLFEQKFIKRKDQYGNNYYWLSGKLNEPNLTPTCDGSALQNNYISVVPIKIDITHYENLDILKQWDF